VTLYGFGLNKFGINRLANGAKVPYHYFSKGERAADDRMNPTHSFDVEYALLRAMHLRPSAQGEPQACGGPPH